jgi:hypothetical protein
MTEVPFVAEKSQEWFDNLKPSVKDMVCNLYEYIEKHSKRVDYINFTKEGIFMARSTMSIFGTASQNFVDRVYYNLDKIKVLVDARPKTKHVYWSVDTMFDETEVCVFKYHTFQLYCKKKLRDKVSHEYTDWSGSRVSKYENHKVI